MRREAGGLLVALVLLTGCGFLFFPGHTFLQADTQIYLPILEHLRDPSVLRLDPVAARPHVSYTIYDEMARWIAWVAGQPFQFALQLQQLIFRALGLWGMYLVGRAAGLNFREALVLMSVFGLGATINGPAVLTFEYEPVPRGYAIPLLVLGIGLMAGGRLRAAGVACGVAWLYHPPSTAPVLAVLAAYSVARRQWAAWAPVGVAMAAGWVVSQFQAGVRESQQFWGTIDATLEAVQRMRGAYNWVSQWEARHIRHYELLLVVAVAAYARVKERLPEALRWMMVGLPVVGVASVGASYALLEGMKWIFIPQFQPARAILWLTVSVIILATTAGLYAARERRWWEAVLWLTVVFAIPQGDDMVQRLLPDVRQPIEAIRLLVAMGLAGVAAYSVARQSRVAWLAVLGLPFYLMPEVARIQNYRPLHHPEIYEVAAWARAHTGKDELFVFPDAGRQLYPGLFRVAALRPLYVDWKGGGQVNLLREFGYEWRERWQQAGGEVYEPAKLDGLRKYGIRWVVLKQEHRVAGRVAAYENARYVVYETW
jgi:hypothetical protein